MLLLTSPMDSIKIVLMKNLGKTFIKYISLNILGMVGISLYILADTFFISMAEGADGITALNLVLPVYSLIFAIGSMLGMGSAIRFRILRARKDPAAEAYFFHGILFSCLIGVLFMIPGILFPDRIVGFLGGDEAIIAVGAPYTRVFMAFTPFFMLNYVCNAFVRNDGAPSLAMAATLSSSLFNIVFDYILMFPCHMGMVGAALATAVSPVLGCLICSIHFLGKNNTICFCPAFPSLRRLLSSCQLGAAAFVGEIASGVTTLVFNFLLLELVGNVSVAAYAVIANTALVGIAIFNGLSQGAQPMFSEFYGRGDKKALRQIWRMDLFAACLLGIIIVVAAWMMAEPIVNIFNQEHSALMASYAVKGVRLYFLGFLFAGFNIAATGYLSATATAGWAFVISILRGFVTIIGFAFLLSLLWGINGVWLSFPAAELLTALVTAAVLIRRKRGKKDENI